MSRKRKGDSENTIPMAILWLLVLIISLVVGFSLFTKFFPTMATMLCNRNIVLETICAIGSILGV